MRGRQTARQRLPQVDAEPVTVSESGVVPSKLNYLVSLGSAGNYRIAGMRCDFGGETVENRGVYIVLLIRL